MKLNLGCGNDKREGCVNVDMRRECNPDVVCNLETIPWIWPTHSVTESLFNHCLEHLGPSPEAFLQIIRELYRVSMDGCIVDITVPHPRHDHFLGDPSHVRAITPELLFLFSKRRNAEWRTKGAANTPLALYLNVDFEVTSVTLKLDRVYQSLLENRKITPEELATALRERNNVAQEYHIVMKAIKPSAMPA